MQENFIVFFRQHLDFAHKLRQEMQKMFIRAQEVILRETVGKDIFR